jgi:hypothetical protein
MDAESAKRSARIAALAARQHGVVSRRQLYAAGLGRGAIEKRLASGQLHPVHRGVFAVGHPGLSPEGRWMAAVLACGGGAVLSHRSAAELWGLLRHTGGAIDVSVPSDNGRRRRKGIHVHRRISLKPGTTTSRRSIPVTTPARTIADLDGAVSPAERRRAIRQAEVLGLRTGLGERAAPTRSELEDRFLHLCRRSGLPMPAVNVPVGRHEVDFLWPEQRLIVETDGYRYHRGSQAFEDDHERDLDLDAHGYSLRRFSYRQVTKHPDRVATSLRQALRTTSPSE